MNPESKAKLTKLTSLCENDGAIHEVLGDVFEALGLFQNLYQSHGIVLLKRKYPEILDLIECLSKNKHIGTSTEVTSLLIDCLLSVYYSSDATGVNISQLWSLEQIGNLVHINSFSKVKSPSYLQSLPVGFAVDQICQTVFRRLSKANEARALSSNEIKILIQLGYAAVSFREDKDVPHLQLEKIVKLLANSKVSQDMIIDFFTNLAKKHHLHFSPEITIILWGRCPDLLEKMVIEVINDVLNAGDMMNLDKNILVLTLKKATTANRKYVWWKILDIMLTIYQKSYSPVILDIVSTFIDILKPNLNYFPSHLQHIAFLLLLDSTGMNEELRNKNITVIINMMMECLILTDPSLMSSCRKELLLCMFMFPSWLHYLFLHVVQGKMLHSQLNLLIELFSHDPIKKNALLCQIPKLQDLLNTDGIVNVNTVSEIMNNSHCLIHNLFLAYCLHHGKLQLLEMIFNQTHIDAFKTTLSLWKCDRSFQFLASYL